MLEYLEWTGPVDSSGPVVESGCPVCFKVDDWDAMQSHFTFRTIPSSKVYDVHLLNQVRGQVPMGGHICPDTRNDIDGGIQSSRKGPDRLEIPQPKFHHSLGNRLQDYTLSQEQTGHLNLLVKNKALSKTKRRKKLSSIPDTEHEDIRNFHNPPKWRPAHDQQGLVVVVTNLLGESVTPQQTNKIPSTLQSTLNFPSLVSASDPTSPMQKYYCLAETDHNKLNKDYKDGLPVSDKYEKEIDEVLSSYASNSIELLSLDKAQEVVPRQQDKMYGGYVRIFGGGCSPPVDNSFQSFTVGTLRIHCKFVGARDYSEHIPLSIGLFHSPFHGIQIQASFISKIQECLGKRGTYHDRNSVVASSLKSGLQFPHNK